MKLLSKDGLKNSAVSLNLRNLFNTRVKYYMADKNFKKNLIIPDTYGLVLIGGNSSRMGTDKSMIQYHKKPQRYHVYENLVPFCEKVFISCNKDQAGSISAGYSFITDNDLYKAIGPMAVLLTAFTKFPEKNMLLIGCDYPFLTANDLQQLSVNCNTERPAGFYNKGENIYEPLLAWYPYTAFGTLKEMFHSNKYSLQYFLKEADAIKLFPEIKKSIISINTLEDFKTAFAHLNNDIPH